jgi:hypothetical protein
MQAANRGSYLVVGITRDILHQKVDEPGVPLKNAEDLQSAISRPDQRFWFRHRYRLRLGVSESLSYVGGQLTTEQDCKETAESKCDT